MGVGIGLWSTILFKINLLSMGIGLLVWLVFLRMHRRNSMLKSP